MLELKIKNLLKVDQNMMEMKLDILGAPEHLLAEGWWILIIYAKKMNIFVPCQQACCLTFSTVFVHWKSSSPGYWDRVTSLGKTGVAICRVLETEINIFHSTFLFSLGIISYFAS